MLELKPFKAYFEYSFNGYFKNVFSETLWSRLFTEHQEREVKIIVHNHSVNFEIPYLKKGTKINLDFEQIHSVSPQKITKADYNQSVAFKFNSKPVEVLQISKDDITFSNDKSDVLTITLNEDLSLKKI